MANLAEKTVLVENAAAAPEKVVAEKRRALGRGLDSLLPVGPRVVAGSVAAPAAVEIPGGVLPELQASAARAAGDAVMELALDLIDQNPYQTRYTFEDEPLQELAESIRANGVVQPIVVRPSEVRPSEVRPGEVRPGEDGRYVLVLGERRCRAAKLAGKEKIPAIVRRISERQAAEMTIIENLQREDLNCMEQAAAFAKLSQNFGLTQEQIGQRVGLSRESVSNYMRLLKLPGTVMQYLMEGQLGFSEARVLLQFDDMQLLAKLADEAVRKHLSVEQLEQLCIDSDFPKAGRGEQSRARWVDPNVRAAQRELETILGVRVRIRDRKGKGKIVIEYATLEDFDRVVEMLKGK
jgi:ParB family chromosome partitioning protein